MRVTVVGAGVVGLVTAYVLAEDGHTVRIVARAPWQDTVSAVAGGLWYPHGDEPTPRVRGWSVRTYAWLRDLSRDERAGVTMERVREWHRSPVGHPWWADDVPGLTMLPPTGPWVEGFEISAPVTRPEVFLPWLEERISRLGVAREVATLTRLGDVDDADVVVTCVGLGATALCGDTTMVPMRGQIVVAHAPRVERGLLDPSNPAGSTYIIRRGGDLMLGGTMEPNDLRTAPDSATTERILSATAAVEPALRGVSPSAVRVGHRPFRPSVRVERDPRARRPVVIHHYGHGMSGYTLSYGSSLAVRALVREAARA